MGRSDGRYVEGGGVDEAAARGPLPAQHGRRFRQPHAGLREARSGGRLARYPGEDPWTATDPSPARPPLTATPPSEGGRTGPESISKESRPRSGVGVGARGNVQPADRLLPGVSSPSCTTPQPISFRSKSFPGVIVFASTSEAEGRGHPPRNPGPARGAVAFRGSSTTRGDQRGRDRQTGDRLRL